MATLSSLLNTKSGVTPPLVNFKEVEDGSRKPFSIPTIYSVNNRANSYQNTWSSSSPWTTFYSYAANGAQDMQQIFWLAMAGWGGYNSTSYNNWDPTSYRQLQFALQDQVGTEGYLTTRSSNTAYGPVGTRIMFIRNFHPTETKTVSVPFYYSNYSSAGYEGSTGFAVLPNTSNYSSTTSTTFTSMFTRSSGNSAYTITGSFSLPAGRTAAVVLHNSLFYYSGTTNIYYWENFNKFYNLGSTTFSDNWIQPDLRMTWAAWTMNNLSNTASTSNTCHQLWNRTAELYGDR